MNNQIFYFFRGGSWFNNATGRNLNKSMCHLDNVGLRLIEKAERFYFKTVGGSCGCPISCSELSDQVYSLSTRRSGYTGLRLIERNRHDNRILWGGSWYSNNPRSCRVSSRNYDFPEYDFYGAGFRLIEKIESKNCVVRGGSWFLPAGDCRVLFRFSGTPTNRYHNLGFRLVCNQSKTKHQINVETQINHLKQRIESLQAELQALEKIYYNDK